MMSEQEQYIDGKTFNRNVQVGPNSTVEVKYSTIEGRQNPLVEHEQNDLWTWRHNQANHDENNIHSLSNLTNCHNNISSNNSNDSNNSRVNYSSNNSSENSDTEDDDINVVEQEKSVYNFSGQSADHNQTYENDVSNNTFSNRPNSATDSKRMQNSSVMISHEKNENYDSVSKNTHINYRNSTNNKSESIQWMHDDSHQNQLLPLQTVRNQRLAFQLNESNQVRNSIECKPNRNFSRQSLTRRNSRRHSKSQNTRGMHLTDQSSERPHDVELVEDDHDWCADSMAVELSSVDSNAVNDFMDCGISNQDFGTGSVVIDQSSYLPNLKKYRNKLKESNRKFQNNSVSMASIRKSKYTNVQGRIHLIENDEVSSLPKLNRNHNIHSERSSYENSKTVLDPPHDTMQNSSSREPNASSDNGLNYHPNPPEDQLFMNYRSNDNNTVGSESLAYPSYWSAVDNPTSSSQQYYIEENSLNIIQPVVNQSNNIIARVENNEKSNYFQPNEVITSPGVDESSLLMNRANSQPDDNATNLPSSTMDNNFMALSDSARASSWLLQASQQTVQNPFIVSFFGVDVVIGGGGDGTYDSEDHRSIATSLFVEVESIDDDGSYTGYGAPFNADPISEGFGLGVNGLQMDDTVSKRVLYDSDESHNSNYKVPLLKRSFESNMNSAHIDAFGNEQSLIRPIDEFSDPTIELNGFLHGSDPEHFMNDYNTVTAICTTPVVTNRMKNSVVPNKHISRRRGRIYALSPRTGKMNGSDAWYQYAASKGIHPSNHMEMLTSPDGKRIKISGKRKRSSILQMNNTHSFNFNKSSSNAQFIPIHVQNDSISVNSLPTVSTAINGPNNLENRGKTSTGFLVNNVNTGSEVFSQPRLIRSTSNTAVAGNFSDCDNSILHMPAFKHKKTVGFDEGFEENCASSFVEANNQMHTPSGNNHLGNSSISHMSGMDFLQMNPQYPDGALSLYRDMDIANQSNPANAVQAGYAVEDSHHRHLGMNVKDHLINSSRFSSISNNANYNTSPLYDQVTVDDGYDGASELGRCDEIDGIEEDFADHCPSELKLNTKRSEGADNYSVIH